MKKRYFQVVLINPAEPDGYRMTAIVEADDAVSATTKSQNEHEGLFAVSAELLCEV
jgi:hypothetical protein